VAFFLLVQRRDVCGSLVLIRLCAYFICGAARRLFSLFFFFFLKGWLPARFFFFRFAFIFLLECFAAPRSIYVVKRLSGICLSAIRKLWCCIARSLRTCAHSMDGSIGGNDRVSIRGRNAARQIDSSNMLARTHSLSVREQTHCEVCQLR
jgi:hypothetical protein